jgi:hypothetical protein
VKENEKSTKVKQFDFCIIQGYHNQFDIGSWNDVVGCDTRKFWNRSSLNSYAVYHRVGVSF